MYLFRISGGKGPDSPHLGGLHQLSSLETSETTYCIRILSTLLATHTSDTLHQWKTTGRAFPKHPVYRNKPTKQTNNETREPVAKHSKTSFPCIRIINYVHFASTQKYLHLPLPQKKDTNLQTHPRRLSTILHQSPIPKKKRTQQTEHQTNDQQEIYHGTWKRPFFEGTVTSSVGKGKSFTFMTGSLWKKHIWANRWIIRSNNWESFDYWKPRIYAIFHL